MKNFLNKKYSVNNTYGKILISVIVFSIFIGAIFAVGATSLLVEFGEAIGEITKLPEYASIDLHKQLLKQIPIIFLCIWLEFSVFISICNIALIIIIKDKKK